jgi:hypothetical protein
MVLNWQHVEARFDLDPYRRTWATANSPLVPTPATGVLQFGEGRILTASLDRRSLCEQSVSAAAFDDVVYKISLSK